MAFVIVSILRDLAIIKWRQLTSLCIYMELAF